MSIQIIFLYVYANMFGASMGYFLISLRKQNWVHTGVSLISMGYLIIGMVSQLIDYGNHGHGALFR